MANFTVAREDITLDPHGSGPIPAVIPTLFRNQATLKRSTEWDLMDGARMEHFNEYQHRAAHGRLQSFGP